MVRRRSPAGIIPKDPRRRVDIINDQIKSSIVVQIRIGCTGRHPRHPHPPLTWVTSVNRLSPSLRNRWLGSGIGGILPFGDPALRPAVGAPPRARICWLIRYFIKSILVLSFAWPAVDKSCLYCHHCQNRQRAPTRTNRYSRETPASCAISP